MYDDWWQWEKNSSFTFFVFQLLRQPGKAHFGHLLHWRSEPTFLALLQQCSWSRCNLRYIRPVSQRCYLHLRWHYILLLQLVLIKIFHIKNFTEAVLTLLKVAKLKIFAAAADELLFFLLLKFVLTAQKVKKILAAAATDANKLS